MDFVEQLKSSVDIVQVIGERVRLRKSGPSRYTGLCPFHTEKTGSFTVHAVFQFYKCFGCGAGGDVLKFVQEIEGISFYEALKLLADRHGIPMPKRAGYSDPDTRLRAALFQMHELAEEAFRKQLQSHGGRGSARLPRPPRRRARNHRAVRPRLRRPLRPLARSASSSSRASPPSNSKPPAWSSAAQDGSFYDRFRNRLMFPIHNETGKVIGFGGRALAADDEPKYLNSPETPIYKKSHVLYNLHRAKEAVRKAERVVLVEGYMDVIGVFAAGVQEVVASCGTSLTTHQVQPDAPLLRPTSWSTSIPTPPATAPPNAPSTLLLEESMHVRIMELEGGLDPDEYCKERGADAYRARLADAKGYFYWLADRARERFGMRTADEKVAVLQFLLPARAAHARQARAHDRGQRPGRLPGRRFGPRARALPQGRRRAPRKRASRRPRIPRAPPKRSCSTCCIRNPEAREPLIRELKPLAAVAEFASRRVFQAVFALHESGVAHQLLLTCTRAWRRTTATLLEVLLSKDD